MARSTGLCDEWYNGWSDDDTIDDCLDRYVRGFDFAQKYDYPPLDFCRKNFRKEDLHRHNIYLDDEVDITDAESGIYIFLGDCKGRVLFNDYTVGTVYLRHSANMRIEANDGAKVFVHLHEQSALDHKAGSFAVLKVYDKRKRDE